MPVPDVIARCQTRSIIDHEQCTRHAGHLPPCSFIGAVDIDAQPLITERPDWLPMGHAFCPGPREKVMKRMWVTDPNIDPDDEEPFSMLYYSCEHGEWNDQSAAWTAHAAFAPIKAIQVPNAQEVTQATTFAIFEKLLDDLQILIDDCRQQIKAL